jgi:superfamily II DNA or RNA helicase
MAQTLCRQKNLDTIPSLDLLIVDEAHHCAAESYKNIIGKIRDKNPQCMIAGFTATPNRGDRKGLRSVFDNCADQITIKELINLGFLVPPIAYVIEINGVEEGLSKVRKTRDDYDMAEVEAVMNLKVINEEVVERWREKAGDRKTIVFCSTIKHAEDVTKAFRDVGVKAELISGSTSPQDRNGIYTRFKNGTTKVLASVMVLTEGFNEPSVSCIILLRPCSYKSTMIQMIGRGLRTVNPEEYPGVVKKDCIVLDFGTSLKTHGDIHTSVDLDGNDGKEPGDAPEKKCPECEADVPLGVRECPLCGYVFESNKDDDVTIEDVTLTEMDVINNSPFRWVDLFGSEKIMIASGFNAFAGVFSMDGDNWHAMGKVKESKILRRLLVGDKIRAISAADDFLRENESDNAAHKSKSWLKLPPTEKQIAALARVGYQNIQFDFSITRYSAAAHLQFQWNRDLIERALFHGN